MFQLLVFRHMTRMLLSDRLHCRSRLQHSLEPICFGLVGNVDKVMIGIVKHVESVECTRPDVQLTGRSATPHVRSEGHR